MADNCHIFKFSANCWPCLKIVWKFFCDSFYASASFHCKLLSINSILSSMKQSLSVMAKIKLSKGWAIHSQTWSLNNNWIITHRPIFYWEVSIKEG